MKITEAGWDIIRYCPNRCSHCLVSETCAIRSHVDRSTASRILNRLVRAGVRNISMKRGEPLLLPWLLDLMAEANAKSVNVHILSGGNGGTEKKLNQLLKLPGANTIIFSLDGHTRDVNDRIRYRGSFHSVCRALSFLKRRRSMPGCKLRVGVGHTVTQNTRGDLKRFMQFMQAFNVDFVDVSWAWDVGSAAGKGFALNFEQELSLQKSIRALAGKYPFCIRAPLMSARLFPHIKTCSRGEDINIDFAGNVFPCGIAADEFARKYAMSKHSFTKGAHRIARKGTIVAMRSAACASLKRRFKDANRIRQTFRACRGCAYRTYCMICPFLIEDLIKRNLQHRAAPCRYPVNVP